MIYDVRDQAPDGEYMTFVQLEQGCFKVMANTWEQARQRAEQAAQHVPKKKRRKR